MSARDKLAEIINEYMEVDIPESVPDKHIPTGADYGLADEIIEAGWRPPARLITTVEELEALPGKTVIEDGDGDPWIKAEAPLMDSWMYAGLEYSSENMFWGIRCPFCVVWEPEQ